MTLEIVQVSPVSERLNPYVYLLARSLGQAGARCEVKNRFSLRWFLSSCKSLDILHFHWGEHLCASSKPGRGLKDLLQLITGLLYARGRGRTLVYTVHNLEPHEDLPYLKQIAHQLLLNMSHGLHVHDDYALSQVRKMIVGRKSVFSIPHGHYIGVYPSNCSRREARERLAIKDDDFVFLFLGQMRPHKGIEDLVVAFRRIARGRDKLLLAGWAPQESYGRKVQEMAGGDSRITFFPQFVANEDVQFFMNASDVSVLPYRTMTTSGAAILSLSFGRPVVAPRTGGFLSLLRDGGGVLYNAEEGGLSNALLTARGLDLEDAGSSAIAVARRLDWGTIARQHLAAYGRLTGRIQ